MFLSIYVKNLYIIHNERTTKINVRWFDIRGFGDKQKNQKYDTYSKIVAYLRISPFTFEQLWKVSGINRNVLKNRLNELVKLRVILKHNYLENIDSLKIKEKIYGRLYKNPYSNIPPMFKRNYYILNFNDFKEFEYHSKYIDYLTGNISEFTYNMNDLKYEFQYFDLLKKYYRNNGTNQNEKLNDINNYPLLRNIHNKINELKRTHENLDYKKLDYIEKVIYSLRYTLRYIALLRELEISAIKERVFLNLILSIDMHTEGLEECLKFFSNQSLSNADIIIRCSTECTWLDNSNVFLPMTDYESLLTYFFDTAHDLP